MSEARGHETREQMDKGLRNGARAESDLSTQRAPVASALGPTVPQLYVQWPRGNPQF